jgi:Ras-related protein Rab-1A
LATCYKNAFGVILVYDVTSKKTFTNLQQWLVEVNEFTIGEVPKLLVGNKSDLVDRRQVEEATAAQFAAERNMAYIETSAIDTANIREAFLTLIKPRLRLNRAASTAAT